MLWQKTFEEINKINLNYKIEDLETNSMINLCKGICGFKNCYRHRTDRENDDVSDLIAESQNILARLGTKRT